MVHVVINNKKYSMETIELLVGQKDVDASNIPAQVLSIAEAVDNPDSLPYLIESIMSLEIDDMDKFRYVLVRVQIDSELHMNEDIQRHHKRLYVVQIIEKLLYGELLLEAGKDDDEDEGEGEE